MPIDPSSQNVPTVTFTLDEACAQRLDESDPLRSYRERFHIPKRDGGRDVIYFAGNSLGLQPKSAAQIVREELDDWARLGVDGHFQARRPWIQYHRLFSQTGARLVGAAPSEVVLMNTLTVNLHLMMATFYRPTPARHKILMDHTAFPSDTYAIQTHLRHRGYDPGDALLLAPPRDGRHIAGTEEIETLLREKGSEIALVLMSGVNYFTGQVFDMQRITAAGHASGCVVGWDLAHAVGNVELQLHDWGVDFAVWCNYKYLNGGPGAVGGCFVHERHGKDTTLPRLGGWWGNDPATRFRMHLEPEFVPVVGAEGWQISNTPIFSLAPVKAAYDLFDEVGMPSLRRKSILLTGYLQYLLDQVGTDRYEVLTPRVVQARGCQISILVHDDPRSLLDSLKGEGVVCDFRAPNVIRIAPVPFYNSFRDVWEFVEILVAQP